MRRDERDCAKLARENRSEEETSWKAMFQRDDLQHRSRNEQNSVSSTLQMNGQGL
jgi:hypothetical protein